MINELARLLADKNITDATLKTAQEIKLNTLTSKLYIEDIRFIFG